MKRYLAMLSTLVLAGALLSACGPAPETPSAAASKTPDRVQPKLQGERSIATVFEQMEKKVETLEQSSTLSKATLQEHLKDKAASDKFNDFIKQYLAQALVEPAQGMGLDGEAVKQAVAGDKYRETLKSQSQELAKTKGRGTPSVFLNGMKVDIQTFDINAWAELLNEQLGEPPPETPAARKPKFVEGEKFEINIEGAPSQGPEDAPLTMVVFSDFECPYCSRFAETCAKVREKFPDKLRLVFMNFPLQKGCNENMPRDFHRTACIAANAALEANAQGKFWEMHDWLFANIKTKHNEGIDKFIEEEKKSGQDKPAAQKVVSAAELESIPAAKVILEDGTLLEERLDLLAERIAKLKIAPSAPQKRQPKRPEPGKVYKFNTAKRPVIGPADAKVEIVLFSDFTCPYCKMISKTLEEVRKEYPDDVKIVYMGFPLHSHKFSFESHLASYEAHLQGKFWEMHDKIFASKSRISLELLRQWAEELGMDMEKYDAAMKEEKHKKILIDNVSEGNKANVSATPTTFINGKWQQGNQKDAIIKSVKAILEKG